MILPSAIFAFTVDFNDHVLGDFFPLVLLFIIIIGNKFDLTLLYLVLTGFWTVIPFECPVCMLINTILFVWIFFGGGVSLYFKSCKMSDVIDVVMH